MSSARITALFVYPIKSCAGILVDTMRFDESGPMDDRRWMVVDTQGAFVTQRELPRLALVRPARIEGGLRVLAPGMPALNVVGRGGVRVEAWCWDHQCMAYDEGSHVADWFSEYLGQPVRLLRFDPSVPRPVSSKWLSDAPGGGTGLTRFTDGFHLSLVARASLEALNGRLVQVGIPPLAVQRFRPNIVVDGLTAFEEDGIESLGISRGDSASVTIHLVKPNTCDAVVEVDLHSGLHEPGLLPVMAAFRADPKLGGAPVFGWNAVLTDGHEGLLRIGDPLTFEYRKVSV